jgi:hypothetical protein
VTGTELCQTQLVALIERYCQLGRLLPQADDIGFIDDDTELAEVKIVLAEMMKTKAEMDALLQKRPTLPPTKAKSVLMHWSLNAGPATGATTDPRELLEFLRRGSRSSCCRATCVSWPRTPTQKVEKCILRQRGLTPTPGIATKRA